MTTGNFDLIDNYCLRACRCANANWCLGSVAVTASCSMFSLLLVLSFPRTSRSLFSLLNDQIISQQISDCRINASDGGTS